MGIREKIRNDPRFGVAVASGFIVLAILVGIWVLRPNTIHVNATGGYYSDDDGATFFEDSIFKFAPFDHNGKPADIAMVYLDDKGSKFVGYLMRYTPDAQKKLQDAYQAGPERTVKDMIGSQAIMYGGMEVKKPHATESWILRSQNPHPNVDAPDGGPCTMVMP